MEDVEKTYHMAKLLATQSSCSSLLTTEYPAEDIALTYRMLALRQLELLVESINSIKICALSSTAMATTTNQTTLQKLMITLLRANRRPLLLSLVIKSSSTEEMGVAGALKSRETSTLLASSTSLSAVMQALEIKKCGLSYRKTTIKVVWVFPLWMFTVLLRFVPQWLMLTL